MPRWWGSGSNSAPPADHDVHEDDHDAGEWWCSWWCCLWWDKKGSPVTKRYGLHQKRPAMPKNSWIAGREGKVKNLLNHRLEGRIDVNLKGWRWWEHLGQQCKVSPSLRPCEEMRGDGHDNHHHFYHQHNHHPPSSSLLSAWKGRLSLLETRPVENFLGKPEQPIATMDCRVKASCCAHPKTGIGRRLKCWHVGLPFS